MGIPVLRVPGISLDRLLGLRVEGWGLGGLVYKKDGEKPGEQKPELVFVGFFESQQAAHL